MYELIYTSAPRGLLQGRSGFCTVAMTTGFPPNLIPVMENMSGYHCFYPPGHPGAKKNPVNCVYQQVLPGENPLYAVSRIEYSGLSYTGRSNILAHHYIFTPDELAEASVSPVDLLRCTDNFPPWTGDPRYISETHLPKQAAPLSGTKAENWGKWTGSSEWAAAAAALFREKGNRFLALGFPAEATCQDLLALAAEVCRLLTPEEQLRFSFSTYCCQNLLGKSLFLRAYPENSVQLESIRRLRQAPVVMLGRNSPVPPELRPPVEQETPDIREPDSFSCITISCCPPEALPDTPAAVPAPAQKTKENTPPRPKPEEKEAEDTWKPKLFRIILFVLLALTMTGSILLFSFMPDRKKTVPSKAPVPAAEPPKLFQTVVVQKDVKTDTKPVQPVVQKDVKPSVKKDTEPQKTAPVSGKRESQTQTRKVSPDEMLEFHLALQNGKTEIPLPSALASSGIREMSVRGVRKFNNLAKEKLADFVRKDKNGQFLILDVRSSDSGITQKQEPVEGKALMSMKLSGGRLQIVHSKGSDPEENIRNIDRILFGNGQTYVNYPPEKWVETAVSRYNVSSKVLDHHGNMQVSWEYRKNAEPMAKEIRDLLEVVVTVNTKVVQRTGLTADSAKKVDLDIPPMQKILKAVASLEKAAKDYETAKANLKTPCRPSLDKIRRELKAEKKRMLEKTKKDRKDMGKRKRCRDDLDELSSDSFFSDMQDVFSAKNQEFWNSKSNPGSSSEQKKMHDILKKLKDYDTDTVDPEWSPRTQFLQRVCKEAKKYAGELPVYQKRKKELDQKYKDFQDTRNRLMKLDFAKEIFTKKDFQGRKHNEMKDHLKEETKRWFDKELSVKIMRKGVTGK